MEGTCLSMEGQSVICMLLLTGTVPALKLLDEGTFPQTLKSGVEVTQMDIGILHHGHQ